MQNQHDITDINLFDFTFDQMWLTTIDVLIETACKRGDKPPITYWKGDIAKVNLFISQLKKTFVNFIIIDCKQIKHQMSYPKFKEFYKEFSRDFITIDDKDM